MPKILFDVRDYKQVPRGKRARIKLFDAKSGEEVVEADFVEEQQQFVVRDLDPGRYRVVVEDEDPELEKEEREIEIKPEEAEREHPLRKRVFLPKKGMSVYYQGEVRIPYKRRPQQIAVDFQPTIGAPNEPLPVDLDDGTKVELKPTLSEERSGRSKATQVFEAEDLSEDQIKQVMAKLTQRDDVRQVGQILHGGTGKEPPVYLTHILIVHFEDSVDTKDKAREIVDDICGEESVKNLQRVSLGKNSYELQLDNASYEVLDKADALAQHTEVVRVEPSLLYPTFLLFPVIPTDKYYVQQGNYLNTVDAPAAWRRLFAAKGLAFGSPEVVIGILDGSTIVKRKGNGQLVSDPDLDGELIDRSRHPSEVVKKLVGAWDMEDKRGSSERVNFHACGVTGLATAMPNNGRGITGIAGHCRLISVGLDTERRPLLDRVKAMAWMSGKDTAGLEAGDIELAPPGEPSPPQQPEPGADVINNSWTHPNSNDVEENLRKLATEGRGGKGMLLVFAAGNDGKRIDDFDLHNNPYVINVAASHNGQRAVYSRWGDCIDVCAPSGKAREEGMLYTIHPDDRVGDDDENDDVSDDDMPQGWIEPKKWRELGRPGQWIGCTSGAAPQVSGSLALALSANKTLTRVQATKLLHDSADHISYPHGEWIDTDDDDDPDFNGEWIVRDNKDGIPDFSPLYGYGQLNAGRLLRLALLTEQHSVYMQVDTNDDGDLFKRTGPAWDSPSLVVEPAADGQTHQVRVAIFNGSDQPISATDAADLRVRFLIADPTTLAATTYWNWLGDAEFKFAADEVIEPGKKKSSEPVPLPAIYTSSPKLLLAQIRGAGHLPNFFDLPHPGDYATLIRWTGLLAFKQPDRQDITLAPGSSHKFTFYIGKLREGRQWSTLRFDLSGVQEDVQVSIKLARSLIDSLLKNNNDQFPLGVAREDDTTLKLDPSQVDEKVIYLRGLTLSNFRYRVHLIQTYPDTPGVYPSSISISQYIEGHWVGMIKHRVKATIE